MQTMSGSCSVDCMRGWPHRTRLVGLEQPLLELHKSHTGLRMVVMQGAGQDQTVQRTLHNAARLVSVALHKERIHSNTPIHRYGQDLRCPISLQAAYAG